MKVRFQGKVLDLQAVWMEGRRVKFIDQRFLPHEVKFFEAQGPEEVAQAIREMVVRGAPAIGAAAAYGMVLAEAQGRPLEEVAELLRSTRPTAHDLFFAVDAMLRAAADGRALPGVAQAYVEAIKDRCRAIGENGEPLLPSRGRILTHCNAGALATVDVGTTMAPLRLAQERGKEPFVWVDETRPRLQGSRLTAWELAQEGIAHTIIVDNAAGHLMQRGKVDLVLVGADRITALGDVANKVGTYEKAVVAREHGLPFYVAAPLSTFDFSLEDGGEVPIEERDPGEVLSVDGVPTAPEGSPAHNPAFDITPARFITAFITEVGVLKPTELGRLRAHPARDVPK